MAPGAPGLEPAGVVIAFGVIGPTIVGVIYAPALPDDSCPNSHGGRAQTRQRYEVFSRTTKPWPQSSREHRYVHLNRTSVALSPSVSGEPAGLMLRSTLVYALVGFQVCRLAGLSCGEVVPRRWPRTPPAPRGHAATTFRPSYCSFINP